MKRKESILKRGHAGDDNEHGATRRSKTTTAFEMEHPASYFKPKMRVKTGRNAEEER